ncbi:hypothetical protein SVAN01_07030 [Stagonosporopsis vannaccii]|nr:hypothetical protein SVAN01_07030 [Stagonosporopsis vannaccii]
MFPLPWARNQSGPNLSYLLSPRSRQRPSISRPHCPDPYGTHAARASHSRKHKPSGFSPLDTPSFSSSHWDDSYALDTDFSFSPPYHTPPPPSPPRHRFPDLTRIPLTLPSATAHTLRPRDILILPRLVHLHILLFTPHSRGFHDIRAAVPGPMAFGEAIKQVVHVYVGDGVRGCDVTARVEQRGRMRESDPEMTVGDLACKGGVFRDGRREVRIEILVEDEGESGKGFMREGGRRRGPWDGDADLVRERDREVGRTRLARV